MLHDGSTPFHPLTPPLVDWLGRSAGAGASARQSPPETNSGRWWSSLGALFDSWDICDVGKIASNDERPTPITGTNKPTWGIQTMSMNRHKTRVPPVLAVYIEPDSHNSFSTSPFNTHFTNRRAAHFLSIVSQPI